MKPYRFSPKPRPSAAKTALRLQNARSLAGVRDKAGQAVRVEPGAGAIERALAGAGSGRSGRRRQRRARQKGRGRARRGTRNESQRPTLCLTGLRMQAKREIGRSLNMHLVKSARSSARGKERDFVRTRALPEKPPVLGQGT